MEQRPYLAGTHRETTAEDAAPRRTAWEREGAAFPSDLFGSWMEAMTRPSDLFRRLDSGVPFSTPLIFYLVVSVAGSAAFTASSMAFLPALYATRGIAASAEWNLLWFFLSPFVAVFSLAISVLITHLGVLVFVRGGRPIGVTARGLCYVAAPGVLNIVPFVGWFVALFWTLWLTVVAVRETHRTTGGRAFAAVFVIPLVAWFLGFLAIVFLVLLAVSAAGTA